MRTPRRSHAKNSVVSKSIKNKNVKTADIKPGAVKVKQLAGNSVDTSKIADGTVGTADIGDGQVGTADIGDGSGRLDDLSTAAKTDLNDAATLGGLTVAQIVAASGGEYIEANQVASRQRRGAPGQRDDAGDAQPAARRQVADQRPRPGRPASGTTPAAPTRTGHGSAVDQPCVLRPRRASSRAPPCSSRRPRAVRPRPARPSSSPRITVGTATVDMTRLVTVAGPTALTLKGSSAASNALGVDVVASFDASNASGSKLAASPSSSSTTVRRTDPGAGPARPTLGSVLDFRRPSATMEAPTAASRAARDRRAPCWVRCRTSTGSSWSWPR